MPGILLAHPGRVAMLQEGPMSEAEKVEARDEKAPAKAKGRPWMTWLALALVATAGAAATNSALGQRHLEETDDAQVEGHVAPVIPRVAGQVAELLVADNQDVKAGQVLARLDDRDLRARLAEAEADLASARSGLAAAQASVAAAEAARLRTHGDLERYARLLPQGDISQQMFATTQAEDQAAEARLLAAREQAEAARAQIAQRQAKLDYARLQLDYTALTAPADGRVTRKSIEVGQFVQPGQSVMAIAQSGELWVVANYKEVQLEHLRVGQKVELRVDAYPKQAFHGVVDSIAPATGARFALFPPDNATGNFTKVVQRVPVKIALVDPPRADAPLRLGMSVTALAATN
jgi:membrane fusion protein (multidrug efflux system)